MTLSAGNIAQQQGFESGFFPELARSEEGSFWFQSRNSLILWALKKYFPDFKSFFEIGCGTGFVLSAVQREFPDIDLGGSEIFIEGLHFASARVINAQLFQMDARTIPFKDEFDVIGAFDVLEHVKEDETVLSQMFMAVHPGGGIIITVPQHPLLWSEIDVQAHHVRRYTVRDLKNKLAKAGFRLVYQNSFVSFLLPFMYISRLVKPKLMKKNKLNIEIKIPPSLNTAFGCILGLERFLIRMGVYMPVGGSLLLVAKKD